MAPAQTPSPRVAGGADAASPSSVSPSQSSSRPLQTSGPHASPAGAASPGAAVESGEAASGPASGAGRSPVPAPGSSVPRGSCAGGASRTRPRSSTQPATSSMMISPRTPNLLAAARLRIPEGGGGKQWESCGSGPDRKGKGKCSHGKLSGASHGLFLLLAGAGLGRRQSPLVRPLRMGPHQAREGRSSPLPEDGPSPGPPTHRQPRRRSLRPGPCRGRAGAAAPPPNTGSGGPS